MEVTPQAPGTAIRCILAGLIALAASACTVPGSDPAAVRQVANRADPATQAAPVRADPIARAAPDDPVKVIGEVLEERLHIMIAAARPATAQ